MLVENGKNEVTLIKIVKNKIRIATATRVISETPEHVLVDHLFFFQKISLNPPVMFEHLSGVGLSTFLDHSKLVIETEKDKQVWGDLRYIHGRSEALKGSHEVTSVLLAKVKVEKVPTNTSEETHWLTQLPDIYHEFMKTLN